MILAGDVGGTKVNLALFDACGERLEPRRERRFESAAFDSLESVVRAFLDPGDDPVEAACFGAACPVVGGACEMPNLDWTLRIAPLREALETDRVTLLNDLEATAYGIDDLDGDQVEVLFAGTPRSETAAVLAAGTGLGAAVLTRVDGRPVVLPTEFGHTDYGPRDVEEIAFLAWLAERHGRVSVERVVSGPGLQAAYEFLRDTGRREAPDDVERRIADSEDPSATISELALDGEVPICVEALDRFVAAYGSAAGNLVLSALALRGIWIGGGIAPAILRRLREGAFLDGLRDKGRMTDLVSDVPVRVIRETRTALLGAARRAALEVARE